MQSEIRCRTAALAWILGATVALGACAQPRGEKKQEIPADVAKYVLAAPPPTAMPRFIDFGGKVHLVGYEIEPNDVAEPGTEVKLRLYWKSVGQLPNGWQLFTHLLDSEGRRPWNPEKKEVEGNYDNVGPLRELVGKRQKLPPGDWEPGRIYVDEQAFEIPTYFKSPVVTIAVGIWYGGTRLEILSGPNAGENRGIVTHLRTGLPDDNPRPTPRPAKDSKGRT